MTESVAVSSTFVSYTFWPHATLKIKEGSSVLGAEVTESVVVSSLESDVHVSFIIPITLSRVLPLNSSVSGHALLFSGMMRYNIFASLS